MMKKTRHKGAKPYFHFTAVDAWKAAATSGSISMFISPLSTTLSFRFSTYSFSQLVKMFFRIVATTLQIHSLLTL